MEVFKKMSLDENTRAEDLKLAHFGKLTQKIKR
jgi:16S rRNA A1518/A1519 N6-dimethyltransferase RsmA/KsgA/DIM1 with predicted DNA glycosylase/AP lyase activity